MPLPESGLSKIYSCHCKDLRKPFTILCVTVLKIDIPSLTDLYSHILISLKGPG